MPTQNWLAQSLRLLADSAVDHPFLIGGVLVLAFLSMLAHVVTFTGHLFLGLSPHFRRQVADLQHMAFMYRDEWRSWKQIFDIARVKSMQSTKLDAELRREQVDAKETTQMVEAVVAQVIMRLRQEPASLNTEKPQHSDEKIGSPKDGAA